MLVRHAQFTHLAPVEGPNYALKLEVPRIEVLGGETKKKEAVRRLEEGTLRLLSALRLKDEIMFTHLAPVEGRNRVRSPANLYPQDEIIVSSTTLKAETMVGERLQYFILKESSFAELPPISSCLRPSYNRAVVLGKNLHSFHFPDSELEPELTELYVRTMIRANGYTRPQSCVAVDPRVVPDEITSRNSSGPAEALSPQSGLRFLVPLLRLDSVEPYQRAGNLGP
ncbi:hypothetical protein B0H14DRAFT_2599066 [Mycena olivaceomarginata]|nr:hypothetical protein B0H14DRAFT_2599066 [Mycena olivaceomarginata]